MGSTSGVCYSFAPVDSVTGFEAQLVKDGFKKDGFKNEDELLESSLKTSMIPVDKDIKEYLFSFENACEMLRRGNAIFKSM